MLKLLFSRWGDLLPNWPKSQFHYSGHADNKTTSSFLITEMDYSNATAMKSFGALKSMCLLFKNTELPSAQDVHHCHGCIQVRPDICLEHSHKCPASIISI